MSSDNKKKSDSCCSKRETESLQTEGGIKGCCPSTNSKSVLPMDESKTSCCSSKKETTELIEDSKVWNIRYFVVMFFLVIVWIFVYSSILQASSWVTFDVIGFKEGSRLGLAVEFFIYDIVKILLLMVGLIYLIAWIRASLNMDRIRNYLAGKRRGIGYFFGSMFGAVTPFCSCSSIPLFLGFTSARIPIGISMSFLITSPLINEIALVLLWGLLGWKFATIYVIVGMFAGILGGLLMDSIKAERWLQPFILERAQNLATPQTFNSIRPKLTVHTRHNFAYDETISILNRVWKWIFIGVGIGAMVHGYVPEDWFAENFGAGQWWSVPAAVLVGIPLYTNVTGIVPIMESLLLKGLPIGTTLAFCMSSVAASIPEFLLLRQIMTTKLLVTFFLYLWIMFTLVGWIFNIFGQYIL